MKIRLSVLTVSLTLGAWVAMAQPLMAQRSTTTPAPATTPGTPAATAPTGPLSPAQEAAKIFADATNLWQTKRPMESAPLYESLVKHYPTSELVPSAASWALRLYYGADQKKADEYSNLLKTKFPNSQDVVWVYWRPIESKCSRDSTVPAAEQIQLLEVYLDRYWAQANFYEAVEMLARALHKANQIKELDAFLTHVLAETDSANMGVMINMIQRACGSRADYANMAAIYGNAAKNISDKEPAVMPIRLLEISYLLRAGTVDAREKDKETPETLKVKADCLAEALKKAEAIVRERPKSEHAAYCELQLKPAILDQQGQPAEAAKALQTAMGTYGIFAMPRHQEQLAQYLATAGDPRAAADVYAKLLTQPCWPSKQQEYLNQRHDLLLNAGDVDGANALNVELAKRFPATRVAIGASLRTAKNLLVASRFDEAAAAVKAVMETYKGDASAAGLVNGLIADFARNKDLAEATKSLREQLIALFPASAVSDEARKALEQKPEDTPEARKALEEKLAQSPVAQAKALFKEYQSFAKESNVEAAQRRIERLLKEFPSSGEGLAAANELGTALTKAGKPELAANVFMAALEVYPLDTGTEERLRDVAAAYNGASKPDEAYKALTKLVKSFRYSDRWSQYVTSAAQTLDAQNKMDEINAMLEETAQTLGAGPQALQIRAYLARRLEGQEKWAEAGDKMLELLGTNASSPEYRPFTGEAMRFLVVAGSGQAEYKRKELKLLDDLITKYEGWDEADRLRLVKVGSLARSGKAEEAIKLAQEVQKRHPKYEIGAHGEGMVRHLSKYSQGLFNGGVGYPIMDRVGNDMSGGWGNYLYAYTAEDMIDYTLLLTQPQAYVDRKKQDLTQLIKNKPNRPANYKSGIPYKTKNLPKPAVHPWPEQRKVYHLVFYIGDGMRRLQPQQTMDPALWLEVYDLWPNYYLNDERIRDAACALIRNGDKAGAGRAMAILAKQYNKLTWEPNVLLAQAEYMRENSGNAQAIPLYRELFTSYPQHTLAGRAKQLYKDAGGR